MAGLTLWVSVTAVIAAILSGCEVLRVQLIVPLRIKSAESATARVISRLPESASGRRWIAGTAFQIAPKRWITAQHVIDDSVGILLKIRGEEIPAQVIYQNHETDLAVLSAENAFVLRASLTSSLPGAGDQVRVVGWTWSSGDRPAF